VGRVASPLVLLTVYHISEPFLLGSGLQHLALWSAAEKGGHGSFRSWDAAYNARRSLTRGCRSPRANCEKYCEACGAACVLRGSYRGTCRPISPAAVFLPSSWCSACRCFAPRVRLEKLLMQQTTLSETTAALAPLLIPLWLNACRRLRIPCSPGGLARLHVTCYASVRVIGARGRCFARVTCACCGSQSDAEIIDLSFKCLASTADVLRFPCLLSYRHPR